MPETVGAVTAEAWIQFQACRCGICGERSDTVSLLVLLCSTVSIVPLVLHVHLLQIFLISAANYVVK
jgi:hypothetical protein